MKVYIGYLNRSDYKKNPYQHIGMFNKPLYKYKKNANRSKLY